MADKTIKAILITILLFSFIEGYCSAKVIFPKETYLTNLNHLNITNESTRNIKQLKELIKSKRPKAIYLEQWILLEPHNKKLIKKLHKIAQKNKIKFYLVVGKNSWIGDRGKTNTLSYFNQYRKYIDGIVLRAEPNKINVWKDDDPGLKAKILNLMLDAYSAIYIEVKRYDKQFIAEFPFWYSDFKGPLKPFPEDVCTYSSKVIFLIDDPKKLNNFPTDWNDITCIYNINLTKRATTLNDEKINEVLNKLKSTNTFYSNFNGFIIDSDSPLLN